MVCTFAIVTRQSTCLTSFREPVTALGVGGGVESRVSEAIRHSSAQAVEDGKRRVVERTGLPLRLRDRM